MATVLVEQEQDKEDLNSMMQNILIGTVLLQRLKNVKDAFNIEGEEKKPSEICYEAARKGTKHIKGNYARDGGYCVMGLLTKNGIPYTDFEKYEIHYKSELVNDNDFRNYSWQQFGDRFAAIGL